MGRDYAGNVSTDTKIILKEIIEKYDETMRRSTVGPAEVTDNSEEHIAPIFRVDQ
jgi:hypothetical protein